MATANDIQKLNETIMNNFDSLNKQISEITKNSSKYDENSKKLSKRADAHEKILENLTKVTKRIETAHEAQIKEIKGLAQKLNVKTYTETIYTDPANEITDDETTQCLEKIATGKIYPNKTQTSKFKQDSKFRERLARENLTLKPTDALRMIENLNGINDIGVEEFIKSIKLAKTRVNDEIILLRMIIAEKITDRAKQSIRFSNITSYDELYFALRTQVSIPNTISGSRNRLQNIKQNSNETVQDYSNRFRQALNELEYAIQAQHTNPIARNLALEQEKSEAIRFYIHNLRPDLAYCIMAMQPNNLLDAQQRAIDADIWIKEMNNRKINYSNFNKSSQKPEKKPNMYNQTFRKYFNTNQNTQNQIKCNNCQKLGHTQNNCYLLKQNFRTIHQGKRPPERINKVTETEQEITNNHNDQAIQLETDVHQLESSIHPDDYNTSNVYYPEWLSEDECSSIPEQA